MIDSKDPGAWELQNELRKVRLSLSLCLVHAIHCSHRGVMPRSEIDSWEDDGRWSLQEARMKSAS